MIKNETNKAPKKGGLLFLVLLLLLFVLCDVVLTVTAPVAGSELFYKNDYEKTLAAHGGKTEYDRVFYGNSVVISAFIEEESRSGFVNFGLDYGKLCDLVQMLEKGMLKVDDELVIGMNYFVLMDTLDTNPSYPWHRNPLEPYAYFERDRIHTLVKTSFEDLLNDGGLSPEHYTDFCKTVYYGMMDEAQLQEKVATHSELFWNLGMENYRENLAAIAPLCDYCEKNGVRLRVLWMPWSDYVPIPENPKRVRALADEAFAERGIEIYDMEGAMPRDCFHDLAHLNYEHGAHVFTEEIDKWLNT